MSHVSWWRFGAYALLSMHLALTLVLAATPLLVAMGAAQGWGWVYNPIYRYTHLALLAFIGVEVALARPCPLMVWENACRRQAAMPMYTTGFFDYWVEALFHVPLKAWLFNMALALLVTLSVWQYFALRPTFAPT